MRGWGGGAVFLAMQVLEIPAGGRGFPLVKHNYRGQLVDQSSSYANMR